MFKKYPSYAKLLRFAQAPVDLTESLSVERIEKMSLQGPCFSLLFGTERVDEKILASLSSLAKEAQAVLKMQAMQRGDVINQIEGYESEKRSVLHTAMRDLFEHPQTSSKAKEATRLAKQELEKLRLFLEKQGGQFTDLVQVGIGGSDLGPRALAIALEPFYLKGRRVHFISNVDPDDTSRVLSSLDLKKTLIVVVSKSGSTLETLTNEALIRERMKKAGLDPQKHFIAITGEKSPMDDPSRYLASFYIWDFVGGRYSATSMVGAFTLSFAIGYEAFVELLKGASRMDQHSLTEDPRKNLPLMSALLGIWNRNFLGYPTVAIIPYSQALVRFPAHLQQLDMESNGKEIDLEGNFVDFSTGPVVWGEPGTNGQHSFYQLIHQGTDVVPLEFIGFKHSQIGEDLEVHQTTSQQKLLANLFAQSIALATGQKNKNPNQFFPGNRPNRILLGEKLTPYTLGALLSYYENKVAFQGFIWGINSFDQEGVQLGKTLATQILSLFAHKPTDFPLAKAYLKHL